jgi:hypothetical protein
MRQAQSSVEPRLGATRPVKRTPGRSNTGASAELTWGMVTPEFGGGRSQMVKLLVKVVKEVA